MLGFILATATMVTLLRVLPLRRILGWATPLDLAFSALMVWMFHGTLAGMTGAAVGGLVLAVALTVGRWLFGYSKPTLARSGRFKWRYTETRVQSPLAGWVYNNIISRIAAVHANAMQRVNS